MKQKSRFCLNSRLINLHIIDYCWAPVHENPFLLVKITAHGNGWPACERVCAANAPAWEHVYFYNVVYYNTAIHVCKNRTHHPQQFKQLNPQANFPWFLCSAMQPILKHWCITAVTAKRNVKFNVSGIFNQQWAKPNNTKWMKINMWAV